jgi:N-acyl-L-homoserine lactone synthetase
MLVTEADADRAGSGKSLELIDALATRWVRAARPVIFRTATPPELDEVFRLRYRTIIEQGWARPEDFPHGLERDRHDDAAIHLVGVDAGQLAATSRLVLPVPGQRMPTEEAFELMLPGRISVVDLNRVVVDPSYRDNGHRIFAGLVGRSWQEARSHGFGGIIGAVSVPVRERYAQLGIELLLLGPARRYWGENRLPVQFAGGETAGLL